MYICNTTCNMTISLILSFPNFILILPFPISNSFYLLGTCQVYSMLITRFRGTYANTYGTPFIFLKSTGRMYVFTQLSPQHRTPSANQPTKALLFHAVVEQRNSLQSHCFLLPPSYLLPGFCFSLLFSLPTIHACYVLIIMTFHKIYKYYVYLGNYFIYLCCSSLSPPQLHSRYLLVAYINSYIGIPHTTSLYNCNSNRR